MHLYEGLDFYYKNKLLKLAIVRAKPLKVTVTETQSDSQEDNQIKRNFLVPNWNNQDFIKNHSDFTSSKSILKHSKKFENEYSERSLGDEVSQFDNYE